MLVLQKNMRTAIPFICFEFDEIDYCFDLSDMIFLLFMIKKVQSKLNLNLILT